MSKELVIASNRHETRLAIVEDEQLVELYFQRANEYSLVGSIHKGRVTRVLPGMQSAFVEIGLERDAFLYVSDFFEESEEYEPMTGGEEEAPRRRQAPPPRPERTVAAPAVAERPPEKEEPDFQDRRGRRSKRRRNRGRGFPESKYAAEIPSTIPPAPPVQEAPETPSETASEFPLLPGESLAKYRRTAEYEPPASAFGPPALREDEEESSAGNSDTGIELELDQSDFDQDVADEEVAEISADETGAEKEDAVVSAPAAPVPEMPVLADEESEALDEIDEAAANEGTTEADAEAAVEEIGIDGNGEELARILAEELADAEPDEPEQPEQAMPERTAATVREQEPRYLHRMPRRGRRRWDEADSEKREVRPERGGSPQAATAPARAEQRTVMGRERPPLPSITDLLKEGQEIIVQIAKEPLGQKGARITSHIALPGRYVVYMPTLDHLGVSRKIGSDEERHRLRRILQAHRAGIPGGFIMRTAGEGKQEKEIAADMNFLFNLWLDIRKKAEKKPAPMLLHHDLQVVERVLRDQVTSDFKTIWLDNEDAYESVLQFLQRFQPNLLPRVKMYTRPEPIFDTFGITAELEKALRPRVWLKSGGYIVINQTEALVAIDINTGKFVGGKSMRLEDTIVKTNLEAIKEVTRQMRLRDLGGIIVVDFIDMEERKNRQKVMQTFEEAMRSDRAPYKILQFNDFGLVAITRKRVKQSLERTLCAPCPYCEGAGSVKSVTTTIGEILIEAQKLARAAESDSVMLRVHPDVAKEMKSSKEKYMEELEEILGRPVVVTGDPLLHHEKFDLA